MKGTDAGWDGGYGAGARLTGRDVLAAWVIALAVAGLVLSLV